MIRFAVFKALEQEWYHSSYLQFLYCVLFSFNK